MILSEIKKYLSDNQRASLDDLVIHFEVEGDAMRGMLEQWIRKGRLRKLPKGVSCPNCCKSCDSNGLEIYEWMEQGY